MLKVEQYELVVLGEIRNLQQITENCFLPQLHPSLSSLLCLYGFQHLCWPLPLQHLRHHSWPLPSWHLCQIHLHQHCFCHYHCWLTSWVAALVFLILLLKSSVWLIIFPFLMLPFFFTSWCRCRFLLFLRGRRWSGWDSLCCWSGSSPTLVFSVFFVTHFLYQTQNEN